MILKIDIGCGATKHKDCSIGLDKHDFSDLYEPGEFIQHDILDPLPFADRTVDWIYCHHVLEHLVHRHPDRDIDALIFVMNEFHRVLKHECEAYIVAPWIEHTNAWRHPTHYRFFNHDLFHWFSHTNPTPDHEAEGLVGKWQIMVNKIQDDCHVLAILRKVR